MKVYNNLLSIVLLLFLGSQVVAQSPQLLKSEGEIPTEFITRSTSKFQNQVQEIADDVERKDKKNQKQFLLESNFAIDDILKSGMVLFNDPASNYVNKVLGNLPFEHEVLKNKSPRVYILNSSAINAFATDQGIIFVTVGLLAKLENEAQLAFILAHELMHIQHRHSIDKFVQSKNIDKRSSRRNNMNKVGVDRKIFEKTMYSRSLEEEADADGLELFLKSNYDANTIANVFEILHYAYLPFDQVTFEKTFFEDKDYIFSEDLWLDSLNAISPMKEEAEEVEEKSTHPSSMKRLEKVKSKLAASENAGKKKFVLPESEFHKIQKIARYQIPFLNLYSENFSEAIYTGHLLLKEYPNDLEIKKVIGKSLYMEAKYQSAGEYEKYNFTIYDSDNSSDNSLIVEGASHQVYNLLNEMNRKEISILALKYNWNLYESNKKDEEMKQVMDDMFVEFASHFEELSEFSEISKQENKLEIIKKAKEEDNKEVKEEDVVDTNSYWNYAFVNELKDTSFIQHYEDGLKELRKREKRESYYDSREGRQELTKFFKKENRKGKSLNINRVVVVNPFYLSIDARRNKGTQFIRSEEKQTYFSKILEKNAKRSKLKATILDVNNLSTDDVDKFNDIAEVNHYFTQQMNHDDLSLTPGYNQSQINEIAKKYGTSYFLWTGVISLRQKDKYMNIVYGLLVPYLLPLILPDAVSPDYDMLYYAILFDVETGRRSVIKMDYFEKKDSKAILNAHVYDVFHQIYKK